jgi:two-component system response regulator YesN
LICITNSKLPDVADLLGVCESIRSEVAETLGFTISIGVSGPLDGYSQISRLYKDSIFCLQEKFFRGSNLLIAYHEISNKFRSMEPLYIKEKQEILIMLRSENRDGFIQLLEDTDRVIMKIRPEIEIIFAAYSEIYTEITKYILENNLTIDGVIPEYANAFQLIRSNETLAGLNHWMVHLYDLVSLNVKNKSKKRSAQLVEKAREFIEGNYWKPELTIEEVSERLFINPSYLSKIFKRDMKISMIEFLTDLRLKKAKEAMDATREMNIGQIAYKVGYTDSFYFSKVFKKTFGVSPSTYMNRKHH